MKSFQAYVGLVVEGRVVGVVVPHQDIGASQHGELLLGVSSGVCDVNLLLRIVLVIHSLEVRFWVYPDFSLKINQKE